MIAPPAAYRPLCKPNNDNQYLAAEERAVEEFYQIPGFALVHELLNHPTAIPAFAGMAVG